MTSAIVYVDGSLFPGEDEDYGGCAWSVFDVGFGVEVSYGGKRLYGCDAMEAECHAVLCGLGVAIDQKYRHIKVRSDSLGIITAIQGASQEGSIALRPLVRHVHELVFGRDVTFEHVGRAMTKRAHLLARLAAGHSYEETADDRVLTVKETTEIAQRFRRLRRQFLRLQGPVLRRLDLGRQQEIDDVLLILREYDHVFREEIDYLYHALERPHQGISEGKEY